MISSKKYQEFIAREEKQAKAKRAKSKQLLEEVAIHEANCEPWRFPRPRFSFMNLLITLMGLVAFLLIGSLVFTMYLNAVS